MVRMSCLLLLIMAGLGHATAMPYGLSDPCGLVTIGIDLEGQIRFSVTFKGMPIVKDCPISMTIADGQVLGKDARLVSSATKDVDQILSAEVPVKNARIRDLFKELTLDFDGGYGLVIRAYPDAVAYRWTIARKGPFKVTNEGLTLHFTQDHGVYFPEEESLLSHSERTYRYLRLTQIGARQFCSLPALIDIQGGPKVAITESDLLDYPGMYMKGTAGQALEAMFPAVAIKEQQVDDRTVRVTERADYIASTSGPRAFPWRVLIIAAKDSDLITNETVYKLASPCRLADTSWIRPGKVAWDWWNANNLYGVDFRAGVNTQTYKYYIDFAAKYGIEYVILDEGWYPLGNLLANAKDMDIEEIFRYAKQKGVGIILWTTWKTLDDQLEPAMERFSRLGAVGVKVDFMQRDDQWMVNYYQKIAEEAAKRHFLVDFHGAYKPTGLRRTYPNVITREGVKGLEHNKWSRDITPEHNVTIPFIRMLAGPMDYTPGAMLNAQQSEFAICFNRPMSQGTRCHQLAMYVVYESPLQMLADSPSNYLREPECLDFLAKVPTTWDQTICIDAKVADYLVVARRKGSDWYLGAMTDWTARDISIPLDFLGSGSYRAEIFQDGINADRVGIDYKRVVRTVTGKDTLTIHLAPGGGCAVRFAPEGK